MLGWWKAWRRKKRLAQPFPEEWEQLVQTRCRHFHGLSDAERQLLRERTLLFIDEKQWEGCNGVVVTAEMQVTIASHAALMGLGFPEIPFERL
ncbi:MAG TPA: zinc-dependent peptidase, partial [Planctomycetaceae bacterium]|nr:zinc-dependent peptidase [Planctomycetaceae bacterium]